ncbi:hypothetical protein DPMN_146444 [Dreissena polymorpha]|uniref:Uncharacterized protein n=1 Tax=Dreissena polymorpha TaxID=45954 RepID=A0A9D4F721_DREPO|nr:hypothetical protein DPMN_146444 [Dreissena polymorpha]
MGYRLPPPGLDNSVIKPQQQLPRGRRIRTGTARRCHVAVDLATVGIGQSGGLSGQTEATRNAAGHVIARGRGRGARAGRRMRTPREPPEF